MSEPDRLPLRFLTMAAEEVVDQASYFERHSGLELAQRWDESVMFTVQSLRTMPQRGALCNFPAPRLQQLRRIPVAGFERYSVFYEVSPGQTRLTVIAVLHTSRDIARLLASPRE